MHRLIATGAVVLLICVFQNLLLSCDGRFDGDDPTSLRLYPDGDTGRPKLEVAYDSGKFSQKSNFNCTLRSPQQIRKLELDTSVFGGPYENKWYQVFSFKTTQSAGYVLCLYQKDGVVINKSNELLMRPINFVAVIIPHQTLALETLKNMIGIHGTVEQSSADPIIFHVQTDKTIISFPQGDYDKLVSLRMRIASLSSIKMTILSTRYCPPVPALKIPVEQYNPGYQYKDSDSVIKCEGDFYTGVYWNKKDLQEILNRLRLLEYQNSTLSSISDVRNFSAALNAKEYVHERELPVLADLLNQLQINKVLNDSETRLNTSNELIANAELKIHKMPLTKIVIQEVRDNFVARVENISQTHATGIMIVDTNANVDKHFQGVSSLNGSTDIAEFFTLNPR
jgi:hypothetical protein